MLTHQKPLTIAQWMRKTETDLRSLDARIANLGARIAALEAAQPPAAPEEPQS